MSEAREHLIARKLNQYGSWRVFWVLQPGEYPAARRSDKYRRGRLFWMLQPGEYSSARRDAFSYCVSLESIQLPDSLEDIGYGLFSGNGNLEVIMTQEQKNKWDNRDYWDSAFARGYYETVVVSFEEFLFGRGYNLNGDKICRITIR